MLAPAIFSYCSEVAPKGWSGATMGLLPIGFSLGNVISGFLSKSMTVPESATTKEALDAYGDGFIQLSLLLLFIALVIVFSQPVLRKLFKNNYKEVIT